MLLVHNVLFVAPWHNAGPPSYIAILISPRPTINGTTRGPADELPPHCSNQWDLGFRAPMSGSGSVTNNSFWKGPQGSSGQFQKHIFGVMSSLRVFSEALSLLSC